VQRMVVSIPRMRYSSTPVHPFEGHLAIVAVRDQFSRSTNRSTRDRIATINVRIDPDAVPPGA